MERARDVMTRGVVTVGPKDTLKEIVRRMSSRDLGGVPVVDHGRLLGIVSRSDVLDLLAEGAFEADKTAAEVMNREVLTVPPERPVNEVATEMLFEGMHRAVVVDGEGALLGVVTTWDLLRCLAPDAPRER